MSPITSGIPDNTMTTERRIAPRTELRVPLALRISTFEGRLREVSTSGARIEHRERLVVGAPVAVELRWDDVIVYMSGIVIRSEIVRRDGAALVYHTGVQFDAPDLATEAVLSEIIFNAERVEGAPIVRVPPAVMAREGDAPEAKVVAAPSSVAPGRPASGSPFMAFDDDDEEQPYVILRLTRGRWSKEYSSSPEQPEEGLTVERDQLSEIDALQRTYETADPMTREMMRRAMGAQLGR